MRTGLDSAYPPTPAQIAQAKAAGYTSWSGYFAGPNILNGWADQDFLNVYAGGMDTSAYCSGWADPAQMKARADNLRQSIPTFVGMLDDESGIRSLISPGDAGMDEASVYAQHVSQNRRIARAMYPRGSARPVWEFDPVDKIWRVSAWVQPWLDTSGFGQYGNLPVFTGIHASHYVFAAYPGADPGASWPSYVARPADGNPCAWQYQGTTSMFGRSVDLTHYDDGFFGKFGPSPGHLTGDDEMLYIGPKHAYGGTLKVLPLSAIPGGAPKAYRDPFASALATGALTAGASIQVDYYVYVSDSWPALESGSTATFDDHAVWHATSGQFIPDAYMNTVGLANVPGPAIPSGEPMALYFALAGAASGGLTMAEVDTEIAAKTQSFVNNTQVQSAINAAIAALPAGVTLAQVNTAITGAIAALPDFATKEQVAQAILDAMQNLPKVMSAHHHSVLGLINTGPVIPDPS